MSQSVMLLQLTASARKGNKEALTILREIVVSIGLSEKVEVEHLCHWIELLVTVVMAPPKPPPSDTFAL